MFEHRSFALIRPLEMRSEREFGGLGVPYYNGTDSTQAQVWEDVVERFYPGCFDECLKSDEDVLCLYDHNVDILLARRSSGTLKLSSVAEGLDYRATFDATDPDHQRVVSKIRRGDVRGSSITFKVLPGGEDFSMENGCYVRHIRKAWLKEVGPTPEPVYDGSTAEARSRSTLKELIERAKANFAVGRPPLPTDFWHVLKG